MLTRGQFIQRALGVAAVALLEPRELLDLLEPVASPARAAVEPIVEAWDELLRNFYEPAVRAALNRECLLLRELEFVRVRR